MRRVVVAVLAGCAAGWMIPHARAAEHVRPYRAVAVTLPEPVTDPSFTAFRAQLAEAARRKDHAALAALVSVQGFFWDRETGSPPLAPMSGAHILETALGLARTDTAGWGRLAGTAAIARLAPAAGHDGARCAPPYPLFKDADLADAMRATGTTVADWGTTLAPGVPVRASAAPGARTIGTLGLHLVRILSDPDAAGATSPVRIAMPSGHVGYVDGDAVAPLGSDQLCYVKDGEAWTISGYIGAGDGP